MAAANYCADRDLCSRVDRARAIINPTDPMNASPPGRRLGRNPRIDLVVRTGSGELHNLVLGRAATLQQLRDAVGHLCQRTRPEVSFGGRSLMTNDSNSQLTLSELGLHDGAVVSVDDYASGIDDSPIAARTRRSPARIATSTAPSVPESPMRSAWPLLQNNAAPHANWKRASVQEKWCAPIPLPSPVFAADVAPGVGSQAHATETALLKTRMDVVRQRLAVQGGKSTRSRRGGLRSCNSNNKAWGAETPPPSLPSSVPSSVASPFFGSTRSSIASTASSTANLRFPPSPAGTPSAKTGSRCIMCPKRQPLASYDKCPTCGTWLCGDHRSAHVCVAPRPSAASVSARALFI